MIGLNPCLRLLTVQWSANGRLKNGLTRRCQYMLTKLVRDRYVDDLNATDLFAVKKLILQWDSSAQSRERELERQLAEMGAAMASQRSNSRLSTDYSKSASDASESAGENTSQDSSLRVRLDMALHDLETAQANLDLERQRVSCTLWSSTSIVLNVWLNLCFYCSFRRRLSKGK